MVGKEGTDAAGKRIFYTVPLDHPILVKDLFRHTTGLDYAGPKDETGENVYRKIEMTRRGSAGEFRLGGGHPAAGECSAQ